jgi:hypothetical protein
MLKYKAHSSANSDEPQDISKIIKLATDQVAIEKACRLIDSYVLEVSQEAQGSPASHQGDGDP